MIQGTSVVMRGSKFVENKAQSSGGAILADGHGVKLEIHDGNFTANNARLSFGGAIKTFEAESLVVKNTTFLENLAYDGGAVSCSAAHVRI